MGSLEGVASSGPASSGAGAPPGAAVPTCLGLQRRDFPGFPTYEDDVKEFKRRKKESLPFVNQDQALIKTARALRTGYPYVVLKGESGIGKSLVLQLAVDVLTGKIKTSALRKVAPEAAELFADVIKKAEQFEHRHYMSLPNLRDAMNPVCLSYADIRVSDRDNQVANAFCEETEKFLSGFANDNRASIFTRLDGGQFRKYVRSRAEQLHLGVYTAIQAQVYKRKDDDLPNRAALLDELISVLHLSLPPSLTGNIKGDWKIHNMHAGAERALRQDAGYTAARNGITKKELEIGLANTILPSVVREYFRSLRYDARHIELSGPDEGKAEDILQEEFKAYADEHAREIAMLIRKGTVKTQDQLLSHMRAQAKPYKPPCNISKKTIDTIIGRMREIKEDYLREPMTDGLREWMTGVVDYFSRERRVLASALEDIVSAAGCTPDEDSADEDTDSEVAFEIKHAGYPARIDQLMQANYFSDVGSASRGVSWTKVGDVSIDSLFATFEDDDDDDYAVPPHMQLSTLGQFFRHGILLFRDSFSDFIETITKNDKDRAGMREQFLDYLQTGVFTLVHKGITFRLEAPRIILACDNDDPFQTIKGAYFVRDETGLRGRISVIDVEHCGPNTRESRLGTLSVMHEAVDEFNRQPKQSVEVKLVDEAAAMLLRSSLVTEGLTDYRYRDLARKVSTLCGYAAGKGLQAITPELLREEFRDTKFHNTFFRYVDYERDVGGYYDVPVKSVGHAHGLGVFDTGEGILDKVRSYRVPIIGKGNKADHFELVDMKSKMAGLMMQKGYMLARDFVSRLIAGEAKINEPPWTLKTQFGEQWYESDGPSASMVITVSMMSELFGDEVYRNRFQTGTIDPVNGNCGRIGHSYYKSLVPWRIKNLSPDRCPEHMYFLFPPGNVKEYEQQSIFDPWDVGRTVTAIPVKNFAESYALFTCGPTITRDNIKHAEECGKELIHAGLKRLKDESA